MRVATWNMQGGSGANTTKNRTLSNMFSEGYDVICLQEATNPLGSFSQRVARQSGVEVYKMPLPNQESVRLSAAHQYTCYWYQWGSGHSRCSLVTYVKNGLFGNLFYGKIMLPTYICPNMRPMLWVRITFNGVIYRIGNVHLISGNATKALNSFIYFKEKMQSLQRIDRHAIIGDFNMNINFLTRNFTNSELSNFHCPDVQTHQSGNKLDYVYYEHGVENIRYSAGFISDHRFLVCSLV